MNEKSEVNVESPALVKAPGPGVQAMRRFVTRISNLVDSGEPLTGFAKTTRQALARNGEFMLSPERIEALHIWKKQWDELQAAIEAHVPDKSHAQWEKHTKDIRERAGRGETGLRLKDRNEIHADMITVLETCKEQQRELYTANLDFARGISEDIAQVVKRTADRILANEKWAHEVWGVQFAGPSSIVAHLRKCERYVRSLTLSDHHTLGPQTIFPYLPF